VTTGHGADFSWARHGGSEAILGQAGVVEETGAAEIRVAGKGARESWFPIPTYIYIYMCIFDVYIYIIVYIYI
jgi:hypothetical protein